MVTEATQKNEPKSVSEPPKRLGLREPPLIDDSTWLQKRKQKLRDLTNYEKAFAAHAEERRHLVSEATRSYFADVHEMREHGGKMYMASNKLIPADKAGYMPDFQGVLLDRQKIHTTHLLKGKISLLSFVYAKYGEQHVDTFATSFLDKFREADHVQLVEVNVQENYLKQFILKAFIPSIRRQMADERRANYVLLLKDITRIRKKLGMTNQYIGYVFLVDENCKIRWTAHGNATPEEVANMLAMTEYLNKKRIEAPTS